MRNKERKKFPLFYKIYFALIALFIVALVIGLWWFRGFLADYEAAQPKHMADTIFEKYYGSGDFTALAKKCAESNPFESADAVAKYLNEHYAGKEMTCTTGATKDGLLTYIVKVGDYKVSSFTLKESESKAIRSWKMYEEGTFEVYYDTDTLTVVVPNGYAVEVDGIALDDAFVAERGIPSAEADMLPEGVEGVTYVRYEVRGLLDDPQIRVTGTDGRVADVIYEEKDGAYHTYPLYDETLKAEHEEYVIEALTAYALMLTNDASWYTVEKYFDPDSEIYEGARDASQYTWAQWDHNRPTIENESTDKYLRFGDDVFSCSVKYTLVMTRGGETFRDTFDSTVIFRNVDGTWKICGMINNS